MDVWVGEDRLRTLTALGRTWETAGRDRTFRVAAVTGAVGSGRTSLLRRWYAACAYPQLYWPPELEEGPAGTAERLYPAEVTPARDTRISYLWWGLRGRRGHSAVLDGQRQIDAHLEALKEAALRADTLTQTRLLAALNATLLIGSLLPLAPALATTLNIGGALLGLDTTDRELRTAFASQESVVAKARARQAALTVDVDGPAAASKYAQNEGLTLARLAAIVPFAVAVDDANQLDDPTVEILRTLSRQSGAHGAITLTLDSDRPISKGLAAWLDEEQSLGNLDRHTLDPLTDDEAITLLLHHLTGSGAGLPTERLGELLAAGRGLPGRLVPHTHAFAELPERAQTILATLALHGPITRRAWLPDTISDLDLDTLAEDGWLHRSRTTETVEFVSDLEWLTAYQQDLLDDRTETTILDQLAADIDHAEADGTWAGVDPALAESLIDALLTGYGADQMPTDRLAELTRLRRQTGRSQANTALTRRIVARLVDPRPPLHLVVAAAETMWDAGDTQSALDTLEAAYDEAVAEHGRNSTGTVPTLANLASTWSAAATRRAGHPDARPAYQHAVHLYEQLLTLCTTHLPSDDRRIPDTRMQLARLHSHHFSYRAAAATAELAVAEYAQSDRVGPVHQDTLTARNNLASWTGQAGDPTSALALHELLLADVIRLLGPHHQHTLTTRSNIASWTGNVGNKAAARDLFRALLPDQVRILGPDHPDVLLTRNHLANRTGQAGRPAAARDQSAALVLDQIRVLGPDDPATLSARNDLAAWCGNAGDPDAARDQCAELLPDFVRVLGPHHPDTLSVRYRLATWTGEAGDPSSARDLFAALLPDAVQVLGQDHRNVLVTRDDLAIWTRAAADVARQEALGDEQRG